MTALAYALSKMTFESLILESIFLLLLVALYTAFWILRRKRFGTGEELIPAGMVKFYLSEIIQDAENLRKQLFGLGAPLSTEPGTPGATLDMSALKIDTDSLKNFSQDLGLKLQAKIDEQNKLIVGLTNENADLKKKNAATPSAGGATVGASNDAELKKKIESLEGKLSEYSVIEDDLANLKRLQQENQKLRTKLTEVDPKAASEIAPVTSADTATAPVAAAAPEAPPVATLITEEAAPAAATTAEPVLESAPVLEPTTPAATPPAGSGENLSKSEADLLSEFEKMLNN